MDKTNFSMLGKTISEKHIPGLGPVLFERSTRARQVIISVQPFRGIRVAVPAGVSFGKAEKMIRPRQAWINKQLNRIKQQEQRLLEQPVIPVEQAKIRLRDRTTFLADKHGFQYNRIFIKNQKIRWGSCSTKNNINLNIQLYNLPAQLQDYVILHELVHAEHRNHGPAFWRRLDQLVGNARGLDRRLRQFGLSVRRVKNMESINRVDGNNRTDMVGAD